MPLSHSCPKLSASRQPLSSWQPLSLLSRVRLSSDRGCQVVSRRQNQERPWLQESDGVSHGTGTGRVGGEQMKVSELMDALRGSNPDVVIPAALGLGNEVHATLIILLNTIRPVGVVAAHHPRGLRRAHHRGAREARGGEGRPQRPSMRSTRATIQLKARNSPSTPMLSATLPSCT